MLLQSAPDTTTALTEALAGGDNVAVEGLVSDPFTKVAPIVKTTDQRKQGGSSDYFIDGATAK